MEDRFTSPLSNEEIKKNFNDIDLFSGITSGLEEAIDCEKAHLKHQLSEKEVCRRLMKQIHKNHERRFEVERSDRSEPKDIYHR